MRYCPEFAALRGCICFFHRIASLPLQPKSPLVTSNGKFGLFYSPFKAKKLWKL
jgi:hypothetical protein